MHERCQRTKFGLGLMGFFFYRFNVGSVTEDKNQAGMNHGSSSQGPICSKKKSEKLNMEQKQNVQCHPHENMLQLNRSFANIQYSRSNSKTVADTWTMNAYFTT